MTIAPPAPGTPIAHDTVAPDADRALTPEQAAAQAIIDRKDYVAMITSCLPTLKAEYYAGQYLMAEITRAGDVQVKKRQFIKAAKRIVGGLPPFVEVALQIIAQKAMA